MQTNNENSQLMRLCYLSHRRPSKAQASLRIHTASPGPSLFVHIKHGSRRRVRPKIKTSNPVGWLRMRDRRMSVRRTKNAIIPRAGSKDLQCMPQSWNAAFLRHYNKKNKKKREPRLWTCKLTLSRLTSTLSQVRSSQCQIEQS